MSNIISGVFCYAILSEPREKYQSKEKEYSIDVVVDKATAKAFGKEFPKQKPKTVDNDEFEGIYKIEVPFADQDEQYIIKLKQAEKTKAGKLLNPPTVYVKTSEGKKKHLGEGILVGNGSTGKVSYQTTENDFGIFAKLGNVLVENLIEYKSKKGEDFGLETDDDFADDDNGKEVKVPAKAKTTTKTKSKPVDEEDPDSPF